MSPTLVDLVAALATGAVGAVALARSDISDTLPRVAIAISLVPPLCVVGLTLESGASHQSVGALLLFVTNVAAARAPSTAALRRDLDEAGLSSVPAQVSLDPATYQAVPAAG